MAKAEDSGDGIGTNIPPPEADTHRPYAHLVQGPISVPEWAAHSPARNREPDRQPILDIQPAKLHRPETGWAITKAWLFVLVVWVLHLCLGGTPASWAVPDRTILFLIDGLAVGAPERIGLPNILSLRDQGCYYQTVHLPPPDHPKSGAWAQLHTSSIPNPVMMASTVFVRAGLPMLQDQFEGQVTAHIASSGAYHSISEGYTHYLHRPDYGITDDGKAVEKCIQLIQTADPAFIRLHLQDTGSGGYQCQLETNRDEPWYRNIWHPDSPYVLNAKKADRLLGDLMRFLETTGRMQGTTLFVTADHGQTDTGWHPPFAPGSRTMPLLIFGQGIKRGATFEYAEMIDIVPTIAHLHELSIPDAWIGRVLRESLQQFPDETTIPPDRYMERLNAALGAHHELLNDPNLDRTPQFDAENAKFLTIQHILDWHASFSDMKSLVEHEEQVLHNLKTLAAQASPRE